MTPKVLEEAKKEAEEAERLKALGDLEHSVEKFKHALTSIRMFCMFTKHPAWFKQCSEIKALVEKNLEELKEKLK